MSQLYYDFGSLTGVMHEMMQVSATIGFPRAHALSIY